MPAREGRDVTVSPSPTPGVHSSLGAPLALVSRALEVAGRLANDAAEVIAATAGPRPLLHSVDAGSAFDWVVDTGSTLERHTRRVLAEEFPGQAVLAQGTTPGDPRASFPPREGEHLWVVDPIDGTANYAAGLPWCCYSLALVDSHGPVVGVVADPYQAELYAAARGRGCRVNGRSIRAADAGDGRSLDGTLICTDLPSLDVADSGAAIRVLGSPALSVTQVVLGRAAAAVLVDYAIWDVAGALALAAESGLVITDLAGQACSLPLGGVIVTPERLLPLVLGLVRRSLA